MIFTNDEIQPTKDNTLYIFDLSDRFKGETVRTCLGSFLTYFWLN
ncbi:hypothetical protein [Spiroplasma endosymbiont of Dactylopius coccus]